MSEKEKNKVGPQSKHDPKDSQVVLAIMKEMGITDYDPAAVVCLTDFVQKYATSMLEEARVYANNSKKKQIDAEDVSLAIKLNSMTNFTNTPAREVLLEIAHVKNYLMLPPVKSHLGIRLPPDRYCLSSANFAAKNNKKKVPTPPANYSIPGGSGVKLIPKPNVNFIKRPSPGVQKVITKMGTPTSSPPSGQQQQRTVLKPKIQIMQNFQIAPPTNESGGNGVIDFENSMKRKREDEIV